jgi:site-specific DNA recombinase
MTRNCVLYARFSTDRQNPKSCADQIREARAYADRQGWNVLAEFSDDGISGTLGRDARPGWDAVLRLVEGGALSGGVVLAWDLDRMSRDWGDWLETLGKLFKARVDLADTKDGRIDQATMQGKVSAFLKTLGASDFIEKLRRNVVRGLEAKREAGYWTSPAPFGYASDRTPDGTILVPDPFEADIVRRIFRELAAGRTPAAVARDLHRDGIGTKERKQKDGTLRRGTWNPSTVRELAKARTFLGMIPIYPKGPDGRRLGRSQVPVDQVQHVQGRHEPLVDQGLFDQVQARLASTPRGPNSKRVYPLAGLVVCGECGGTCLVTGGAWPYRNYRCRPYDVPQRCASKRIVRVEFLEQAVQAWCAGAAQGNGAIRAAAERIAEHEALEARRRAADRAPIEAKVRELLARQQRFADAIGTGTGAPEVLVERLKATEAELTVARAALEAIGTAVDPLPVELVEEAIHDHLAAGAVDLLKVRPTIERIVLPADHEAPPMLHVYGAAFPLTIQRSLKVRIPKE